MVLYPLQAPRFKISARCQWQKARMVLHPGLCFDGAECVVGFLHKDSSMKLPVQNRCFVQQRFGRVGKLRA